MLLRKKSLEKQTVDCDDEFVPSLEDCIAKTCLSFDSKKQLGINVLDHCLIVGEVAINLILNMPHWLRERFFFPGVELIAAAHDIGKVCPTFQEKIRRATAGYNHNSFLGLKNINPELEKEWGGHATVSQLTVRDLGLGKNIGEILGQHHGYSQKYLGNYYSEDDLFGGPKWHHRRVELLFKLKKILECDWPNVENDIHTRVLAGFTTIADWIGSASLLGNLTEKNDWKSSIKMAVEAAGFVQPKLIKNLTFEDIYEFKPHKIQEELIYNCKGPGLYILEAPMGLGKTEAALYSAYNIMAQGMATGIYFALPTQLTSDVICERMNGFLAKILSIESPHRESLLLHGNAWLKVTEMGEEGQPGGSWFNSGKRGILAPFAVGTIDQALMSVMNVKHSPVRLFGLAGKVVILDEVHSYDAYTGTIINRLIEVLRELKCVIIILSATLTSSRRQELIGANVKSIEYPLITACPTNQTVLEVCAEPLEKTVCKIKHCSHTTEAINEALKRAGEGQQVLWIENTVAEAQELYRMLASKAVEFDVSCGLIHSRFIKRERSIRENEWVSIYGKSGIEQRKLQGRILIGTQVLEQSLDIDADFLITRVCPTDMLLQRIGRLWRHKKTSRCKTAEREAWIISPDLEEAVSDPIKAFGKTAIVYSPYVLIRTLEVWKPRTFLELPSNIRELIEATYVDRVEKVEMNGYLSSLKKKCDELERMALVGLSEGGKTLSDNNASTRYSEQDSVDVLLIRSYRRGKGNEGVTVTFLNGEELYLPLLSKKTKNSSRRDKAALLMQNTLRVSEHLAPKIISLNQIQWLKDYVYIGDQAFEEYPFRIAVVRPSGELLGLDSGYASSEYTLTYDSLLGYQAIKK